MKRGLVVGKFYPPHQGHSRLIRIALASTDEVTVLVIERSDQLIPGTVRARLIKEMHPAVRVLLVPDIGLDDDALSWAKYTEEILGYRPDKVFAAGPDKEAYAGYLGAEFVPVDPGRNIVPISATEVRADPYAHWDRLEPPVRALLAKRIVLVGPESTGKTTLAKKLAERFGTAWVPEYGRFFSEGKGLSGGPWKTREFEHIADTQNRMEDALAYSANRVLICDTNAWATGIWHRRYLGERSPRVDAYSSGREYDRYLLTAPDVPFVDDGLRDGESVRSDMFGWFREALDAAGATYEVISGSYDERYDRAALAVERTLALPARVFSGFPKNIVEIA